MLRSILAVIVSYIAMCILVMGLFMGMWFGLGPDGLLKPGSYQGNTTISILAPSISILGGLFGGFLCTRIAKSRKPAIVLAVLTLTVGLSLAFFVTLKKPYPADPRPAGMTVQQIMEIGREPDWFAIANPIIGAIAILLGGLCVCKSCKSDSKIVSV
jgi:ribose/xylose/arabinose/galactoside ABC-type transport system permease subunit